MRVISSTLRFVLYISFFAVTSCTKTIDTPSGDSVSLELSEDLKFPTTNEFSNCKLRRIYHNYEDGEFVVNGLFTYNKAGDPVSLTYTNTYPGLFNWYFTHDKQGRLIEARRAYGLSTQDRVDAEVHRYGYGPDGRIITDTIINNPGLNDPQEYYETIYVSTLTYDNKGRIVKESIKNIKNRPNYPLESTRNPTYTYDSRGNLGVIGFQSSAYDKKVSIFRAHPVFQFIHRNYSVNNAAPQAKYNSKGLPLSVTTLNDAFFNSNKTAPSSANSSTGITKAIYDCQ